MDPVLVLFTRDLRVHDHPALHEACERGGGIVPLFVLDPGLLQRSANRTRFLMESLHDLDHALRSLGGRLLVREGDPANEAARLAREAHCREIWMSDDASEYARQRASALTAAGYPPRLFPGNTIVEPGEVTPAGRDHYRIFSPYLRSWSAAPRRQVLNAPTAARLPDGLDPGVPLDPARLSPGESPDVIPGGETAARARLQRYATATEDGAGAYADLRNTPGRDATSRLSPALRFGCISPLETATQLRHAPELVRQLAWRDFFLQLLGADPSLSREDLRPPSQGWRTDPAGLEAWKEGRTGLPLVDAGMRQLQREGWMHGRVRMAVGSLLTRRLEIDWREGRAHFDRLLLDGDVASNAGNWQWVAGTGTDPRRGRVLNPVRQARRFDPDGSYVRRYVSELADVPIPLLFAPWRAPDLLRERGYPSPIVEVLDR